MNNSKINKNTITPKGWQYSNYVYTFTFHQSDNESDHSYLLPYQIETNKAFLEYLDGSENILERFRNALILEENYITIMNMCVISLAQRTLDDLEDLALKAKNYSNGETHHIIFLVEFYLLIHDDDKAIKYLIELFINKAQQDVVLALLREAFSRKMYSIEHLLEYVQDNCILVELIKINKQCFIQHQSYDPSIHIQIEKNNKFYFDFSQKIQQSQVQQEYLGQEIQQEQEISFQEQQSQQINNTYSYQTQETDQLSFISQTQDNNFNLINCSLLDFSFIDIILDNPNLFSFQFRLPYMIGSHSIKEMNKLQAKIAEGGFGEVYVAKHLQTNEIHALKIIKQQEDFNVNLILQEIIIQDKIQKLNPQLFLNLKPLIYLKKESKLVDIFIPLELGQFSLYEYIQEHQIDEYEYNQFYNFFIDYIVTLHSNKYAHRDIKPQNILYIKDVGWKLADFGESINYDNVEDIYKIRGTIAFLPFRVRRQSKQYKQIKQNLLQNDLYAVVCTLIMIKNPKFNSQDLTYYMDNTQLDQQLQQLLQNFENIEMIEKLKVSQQQQIQTKLINKKYILDQECQWNWFEKLKFYKQQQQQLDNEFIQQLDELLGFYKEKQQKQNFIYLTQLISQYYPFQIDKFKNIIIFNFQRHLLPDFQSINVTSHSYYHTIIEYFLLIKLYDLAIRICDKLMKREYALIFHLLKIQTLIYQGQEEQAKEELELIYRYFISTQSYSLQEQMIFFNLYKRLHNKVPQIKVDKTYKDGLIQQNQTKSNYHASQVEWEVPINMEIVNQKQHLQLRLNILFEFVYQDPYKINKRVCEETVQSFGQFIEDGQLVNCDELIQLIKENLNFWTNKYITKIHIIAIGLNYIFNYYGKFQIALNIGQYFHNILRNIGSCEAILDHYEHLLNTQIIVYQYFNQQPTTFIDLNRCLDEVQYLSLFDQIYINLKCMTIWHIIRIKFEKTLISQEQNKYFKLQIIKFLNQLNPYFNENRTNQNQRIKLINFLFYMIMNFMKSPLLQLVDQLQIVKKIFRVIQDINYGEKTLIRDYNNALLITRQHKLNLIIFKQYIDNDFDFSVISPQILEGFLYKNLIKIFLTPLKVLNILNKQGFNKMYSLIASINYNFDSDLKIIIFWYQHFKVTRFMQKEKQKIDQISLRQNYFNL